MRPNEKRSKEKQPKPRLPKKKRFEVDDYGSIEACLNAMKTEGYLPVRRTEKPVFMEGETGLEVAKQVIVFEGRLIKDEQ